MTDPLSFNGVLTAVSWIISTWDNHSGSLTAIFTILLVIVTFIYVYYSKQALTAHVVDTIMRDYSRQEMFDAKRELRQYNDQFSNREKLFKAFRELRNTDNKEFERLENYRRIVSHHFLRIYYLKETGAINKNLMRKLSSKTRSRFYLEIIEPMEAGKDPNYNKSSFNLYRKLYPELKKELSEISENGDKKF